MKIYRPPLLVDFGGLRLTAEGVHKLGQRLERVLRPEFVDYAGGVVALISAAASAFSGGYVAVVLLLLTALLAVAYARKVRANREVEASLQRQHAAHVACVKNLNAMFAKFSEHLGSEKHTPHLGLFVNRLKSVFDHISSSGQSAVCIKLLVSTHERPEFDGSYIWTARRDDASQVDRGRFDNSRGLKRYRPREN